MQASTPCHVVSLLPIKHARFSPTNHSNTLSIYVTAANKTSLSLFNFQYAWHNIKPMYVTAVSTTSLSRDIISDACPNAPPFFSLLPIQSPWLFASLQMHIAKHMPCCVIASDTTSLSATNYQCFLVATYNMQARFIITYKDVPYCTVPTVSFSIKSLKSAHPSKIAKKMQNNHIARMPT